MTIDTKQLNFGVVKEYYAKNKKEIHSAGIGALVILVVLMLCFFMPRPTIENLPATVKDTAVTLQGKTRPNASVVVFNEKGQVIMTVNANESGDFTLQGLPIEQGKNVLKLRAARAHRRMSLTRKIVITRDTMAPRLEVSSLAGSNVSGSGTVVSGKAEPGSTVTVNGVKTQVNADGTWSATVALNPGTNTVTVSATDAAGNTTTETQTVKYTPSSTGSTTGTTTVTSSTSAVSAGSQPASIEDALTIGVDGTTQSAAPGGTTSTSTTTQQENPIIAITTNAWVSNPSPNTRANETIYASVKDNYGRPVANASVIATVSYKTGSQNYSLSHQGNGTYAVSFKLNDKFVAGYQVAVSVTAKLESYSAVGSTSFTPQSVK